MHHSCSGTKLSPFCVGWYGDWALASPSSLLEPSSEKLPTFSKLYYSFLFFLTLFLLLPLRSAFRYCCAARGEKLEKTKIQYGCLAKVVRDGGFKIALIARFSAIPGHCA